MIQCIHRTTDDLTNNANGVVITEIFCTGGQTLREQGQKPRRETLEEGVRRFLERQRQEIKTAFIRGYGAYCKI